ncbi:IS30 family transposase, partial [Patescibacteria group bacterium]|nr:IS30 family transposase [Patescibacteria group bacterium]MBU1890898.1 IS30 family transposase [Patescibacteria group bacterium]
LPLTNDEMSYKHITSSQRNELFALLRVKTKQKDIARLLEKDRITIWREEKRNKEKKKKYHAGIAKEKTTDRQVVAHQQQRKIENNTWLRNYIIKKIKKRWSPEQIAGRLKKKWPNDKCRHIGKDSIYKYIHKHRKDLVKYLRCQKGKYRRRYGTRIREKQREETKKKRIDKRPAIVEKKVRIGDWEGDTILGKDKNHILTHAERKSGLILADKLSVVTAEETKIKTVARFKGIPKKKKHTVTYDNGSTFSEYELTERETGLEVFFAYPYHSWERGCNENANGLLRQYFPKQIRFANVKQEEIDWAVSEINNRPRKRLDYLTPNEVFYEKNVTI